MFDDRCNKYTDCASCEHFQKQMFKYRTFSRGFFVPRERCTQHIIYFVLTGEVWLNSHEHPDTILREGQFVLQPMGSSVEFRIHTQTECVLYLFDRLQNVCDARFLSGLNYIDAPAASPPVMTICAPLLQFMAGMKLFLNDDMLCAYFLQAKRTELFFLLNCYYTIKDLAAFYAPVYSHNKSFRYFVLHNYRRVKDVEDFASLGGYSLSTFRRMFKETFDEPAYQWMLKQKCEDIRNDLMTSELTVSEISTKYGFESLPNFSHFCRTNFGKSPRALRAG